MPKKERKLIISTAIITRGRGKGKCKVNIQESESGHFVRYGEVYSAIEFTSSLWEAAGDKNSAH